MGERGTRVVGVDCSTQATKIVVCAADSGRVLAEARAPHPDAIDVSPQAWWDAFSAAASGLLDGTAAIGVSGQQHGMVALDAAGAPVRPALLWNDTRSAPQTEDLIRELGGPDAWAAAVGSVPVASFTVTKLRWLAEREPESADRVARVLLPHDWLTWRLLGSPQRWTTDRGDASGTGYWSPRTGRYRRDLVELAFGRVPELPAVLAAGEQAGETAAGPAPGGLVVSAGTGDNMAVALGLSAEPGDVVVSLGTSGTVFAVHPGPTADPSGTVAGFADATGRFLPLVCTLNAARVLSSTARLLGTDLAGLDRRALAAAPGADGLVLLPYLDGERTPNLPDAAGTLSGLRRASMTADNVARAAVEGMLCGLADGLDALRRNGVPVRRVLLVGGAARSAAVRAVAPLVFGAPVVVPPPAEYAAIGAARQAAWALAGSRTPPRWQFGPAQRIEVAEPTAEDRVRYAEVRGRYAGLRDRLHGTENGTDTGR